jgi:hypothetical protein
MMTKDETSRSGYDQDFFLWTQKTARAIEAGRFDEIDKAALADEVESLGKRDRREVESRLGVIVMHMLKAQHQPEKQTRSWQSSINRERRKLAVVLKDSPSLRAQLPELLKSAYKSARREAADETGISLDTFAETCQWSVTEIIGCAD